MRGPTHARDVRRDQADRAHGALLRGLADRRHALVADLVARREFDDRVQAIVDGGQREMLGPAEARGRHMVALAEQRGAAQVLGATPIGVGNRDGALVPDEVRRAERWCTCCR